MARLAAAVALAGLCACVQTPERPAAKVETTQPSAPVAALAPAPAPLPQTGPLVAVVPIAPVPVPVPAPAPASAPVQTIEIAAPPVVTVQPEEPRYLPPESLKKFRYAQKPAEKSGRADQARKSPAPVRPSPAPAAQPTESAAAAAQAPVPLPAPAELPGKVVTTVTASGEAPRYALPESLAHWNSGRKVPLYVDPEAAPWQATPTEPRLQNAAVSCNYKDEGGVRGKATLLVDNNKLTRFFARIEMPNGGVCQFDSKKMEQLPFEQGIALQSKGDECIVRMWEQQHRITIAAYSCHKQCSRGSFSYLWPIIMDTRVGTCY